MALDATVGGSSANSYLTRAEADTYFGSRLHSAAWTALSEGDKEAALLWATRIIEARIVASFDKKDLPEDATIRILTSLKPDPECTVVWRGDPASSDQALAWPRSGLKDKNGFDLADNVIPHQLKDFQCEVALGLIAEDRTKESEAAKLGLNRLKAGPVELGWKNEAPNLKLIPDSVMQVLAPSWWYAFELKYERRATLEVL